MFTIMRIINECITEDPITHQRGATCKVIMENKVVFGESNQPGVIVEQNLNNARNEEQPNNKERRASKPYVDRKTHPDLRLCRSHDPNLSRMHEKGKDFLKQEGTRHHSLLRSKSDTPPSRTKSEASIADSLLYGTDDEADACRYANINRMLSPRYLTRYITSLEKISEHLISPNVNVQYVADQNLKTKTSFEIRSLIGAWQRTRLAHSEPDMHALLEVNSDNNNSKIIPNAVDSSEESKYRNVDISKSSTTDKNKNVGSHEQDARDIGDGAKSVHRKTSLCSSEINQAKVVKPRYRLFRSWSAIEFSSAKTSNDQNSQKPQSDDEQDGSEDDFGFLGHSLDGYAMQKASPSTGRRILPRIRRSKPKTQTSPKPWSQKGHCSWTSLNGRQVVLGDVSLLELSEKERLFLIKVAIAKLQSLELGCTINVPKGDGSSKRGKKLFSIARKRSNTTHLSGILDNIKDNFKDRGKDKENKECSTGYVFGIPLRRCIANDAALKRRRLSLLKERTELIDSENTRRSTYRRSSSDSFGSYDNLDQNGDRSDDSPRVHHRNASCDSLLDDSDRSPKIGRSPSIVEALSLQEAISVETRRQSLTASPPQIPHVVQCCFQHLKTHGMQTLGIFRVGSSKKRTRQLREEFDSGKDVRLTDEHNPHDIGALLKEFFRDLPEPLLTRELYCPFVATRKITDLHKQVTAMQCLLSLLPPPNRDTLWSLLYFLSVVVKHSSDAYNEDGQEISGNKMDSHNLATLFGPNLLHKAKSGVDFQVESAERAEERRDVIEVIQDMIETQDDLFRVPAERYNEVIKLMLDSEPDSADYILRTKTESDTDSVFKDSDLISNCDSSQTARPRTVSEAKAYSEIMKRSAKDSETSSSAKNSSGGFYSESSSSRTRKLAALRPPDLTITPIGDDVFVSDSDSDIRGCLTPDRYRCSSVSSTSPSSTSPMKTEPDSTWNFNSTNEKSRCVYSHRKSSDQSKHIRTEDQSTLDVQTRQRGHSPVPARSRSPRPDRSDSFSKCLDTRRSSSGSNSSSLQRPLQMTPVRTNSVGQDWQQTRWQHWERMASKGSRDNETLV